MSDWNFLAFLVFPYVSLTIFVVGHIFRYFTDPYRWNAKSSELLERENLNIPPLFFTTESSSPLSAMPEDCSSLKGSTTRWA